MDTLTNTWYLPHHVKFFLILILLIPSTILCVLIFAFFIIHRTTLRKLQNKALLVLLIVNFIQLTCNLPICIHFFRLDRVSPATVTYCKWWLFLESTLDAINEFLVAIISIQRHILIFQPNILNLRSKRYILYYQPLLLCIIYPIVFYMITVVFYPCDNTRWDFTSNMCGQNACYYSNNQILAEFDWIGNTAVPTIVILLANVALVIRVIKQKRRRRQTIPWSKQRRMTLQLLGMSSLYLITWIPSIVVGFIQQLKPSSFLYRIEEDYIADLTYLICLFLPWICIGLLPEFKKWVFKLFHDIRRPHHTVTPA